MEFKLSEILDEDIFKYPIEANLGGRAQLIDNLERYKIIISNLKPDNPVSIRLLEHAPELSSLCKDLQTALDMKDVSVSDGLLAAFNRNWDLINALMSGNSQHRLPQTLFRCRKLGLNEIGKKLEVEDIYHLPSLPKYFDKKGRYNSEGSACLYLGSSLLCCWTEIRSQDDSPDPSQANVIASRFQISRYLLWKVLDLSIDYQQLSDGISQVLSPNYFNQIFTNDTIYKYISFYPIILAMSLQGEHSISQLFIRWVQAKANVDLVIYTSTHFYNRLKDYSRAKNYAFMVRDINSTGYDERLKSIAKTSVPILLKTISTQEPPPHNMSDLSLMLSDGESYSTSYFAECETYLQKLPIEADW